MNMGVQIVLQYPASGFFGYMLRGWIAGSYGSYIFSFSETFILFPIVAAPFYILVHSTQGLQFSIFARKLIF